ncbi:MAG TPA: LysR family transcriptional regulator [Candidatus Udaeobacter sp.]|jgi:LysR family hydrogen peroxide-inducible transcriptional activator|nr:LysR family transcriptional regulator [Candidatus Udaeobacter sp.]
MEVHQLRYFVAVADEGNFSRAAAKVRVAQPSLSQQIRKLEAEIGQPLFDRLPRSVVLTEAGRSFIEYARQILASIGDARRCVDELKETVTGKLAVGAIPTIAPYVLPELVVKFQKDYPEVALELVEDVTDGITRRIDAGELDVALASTCKPSPTLRRQSLGNEPLLALIPEGDPLATKTLVELEDLKSKRFLLLHEMHCLSQQVHHLLETRRLRPEIALAGSQLTTIARMVAAGIGVSIVPQMMVKHQATPGCVSLSFAPPGAERELNFVHNPLRFQSKAAAAFRQETAAVLAGQDSVADDAKS